jgi:sec-independent protein translocase protein TatA
MGLNFGEALLITGIAVLCFGGKKIPELGKTLGKSIKGFKEGLHEDDADQTKKPDQSDDQKKS